MSKLSPTLLALAMALAFATVPAAAQQITTSHGIRTLPRTDSMKTEAELRQVLASAEQVLAEVMADVDAAEKSYGTVGGDAAAFPERIKAAKANYEREKAAFEVQEKTYRDALAAYDRRRAAHEDDIRRQRAEAAPLEALPSAQRDIKEVYRLNEWSDRIAKEREAVATEGNRLLAEHDAVEVARAKVDKLRLETDAGLAKQRESLVGDAGSVVERRKRANEQLRITADYADKVRVQLNGMTANKVARSPLLERALAKVHPR